MTNKEIQDHLHSVYGFCNWQVERALVLVQKDHEQIVAGLQEKYERLERAYLYQSEQIERLNE